MSGRGGTRGLGLRAAAHWGLALGCACTGSAAARPQLVVVIDTDAPLLSQAAEDETIARDAAIDTVRIDVLGAAGETIDLRTIVAPDVRDWPISFGIARTAAGTDGVVRLRVRAFAAHRAAASAPGDMATLEPPREVTIDRAVLLLVPNEGVRTARVLLASDCIGRAPSFVAPGTTCVDAARTLATHDTGVEAVTDRAAVITQVGTWPAARARPCEGTAPAGAICIPGGYVVLGDRALVGVGDGLTHLDPIPLRAVVVSPFYLDRTEVTVGRYRALVAARKTRGQPPRPKTLTDAIRMHCTWIDARTADDDALPLNCLEWASAAEVCKVLGGALPTSAQWEHAARGRGRSWRFPWGDDDIRCCGASYGRAGAAGATNHECTGIGVESVAAHADGATCAGLADVSRDGVVDLAGGVQEYVRDSFVPLDAACWGGPGLSLDPVCDDPSTGFRMARGGTWANGSLSALSAMQGGTNGDSVAWGFRCAYPGVAP